MRYPFRRRPFLYHCACLTQRVRALLFLLTSARRAVITALCGTAGTQKAVCLQAASIFTACPRAARSVPLKRCYWSNEKGACHEENTVHFYHPLHRCGAGCACYGCSRQDTG